MKTLARLTPHVYKPHQQYFNIAGISLNNFAQSRVSRANITDLDVDDTAMLPRRPITRAHKTKMNKERVIEPEVDVTKEHQESFPKIIPVQSHIETPIEDEGTLDPASIPEPDSGISDGDDQPEDTYMLIDGNEDLVKDLFITPAEKSTQVEKTPEEHEEIDEETPLAEEPEVNQETDEAYQSLEQPSPARRSFLDVQYDPEPVDFGEDEDDEIIFKTTRSH